MPDWGPLGDVLGSSPGHFANVERATAAAAALLKTVRDTFPAYTLHDEEHAHNVVRLMGRLVAPRIDRLEPLEAGLMILSAYFHDIGMSYSPEERAAIPQEEEFRAFLRRDPDAFLSVHDNGGMPTREVLEQYGRLRHADRVRVHLDRIDRAEPELLCWDGISLVPVLHRLCRSHNESAGSLHGQEFGLLRGRADTRFCAMMLRLADIMDVGRTRAPRILFDYLGLAEPDSVAAAESARHWKSNMACVGFDFPPGPPAQWPPGYPLTFAANPRDPDVEHAIRRSLDEVRTELDLCRPVRDGCRRWSDLPLPGIIDDRQIEGLGYTYREFRFELDRAAVLELFTGEQLYGDPSVALRELLQNAIDAVQTRVRVHGEIPGSPPGVDVTCWEGRDGFVWLRVDDTGTGMDERIIRDYFLRVGRSYYTSAEFRAELIRSEDADGFQPISRFGIGVLSSFMAGDRVEVSTRRLIRGGRDYELDVPLRLSLRRDRDYFVLRTAGQGPDDMPAPAGDEGFRRAPGTGIAIRIDPHRTGLDLDGLTAAMRRFVATPPVPVTFNGGVPDAGAPDHALRWLDGPVVTALATGDRVAEDRSGLPYLAGMRVVAIPLDLSRTTEVTAVSGQLLATVVIPPEDTTLGDPSDDLLAGWTRRPAHGVEEFADMVTETDFEVSWRREPPTRSLQLRVSVRRWLDTHIQVAVMDALATAGGTLRETDAAITESERAAVLAGSMPTMFAALAGIPFDDPETWSNFTFSPDEVGLGAVSERIGAQDGRMLWSHGGIRLPADCFSSPDFALTGALVLTGPLRPDVTVSRTRVRAVPLRVQSAVHLAVRLAAADLDAPPAAINAVLRQKIFNESPGEDYSLRSFGSDPHVAGRRWNGQQVIPTSDGYLMCVDDLLALQAAGEQVGLTIPHTSAWADEHKRFDFYGHLATALLALFVSVEYSLAETYHPLRVAASPARREISTLLPPLFAVPYRVPPSAPAPARASRVRQYWERQDRTDGWLNADHPLAIWISDNAERLARDFPAPFNRVFRNAPWLADPEEINTALDRVRSLNPPPEAYVRADDDGWWWSR